ncbi:MAG: adenylate/guanylate cyclase domain-containing protein [Alphaproteobacteria bacterium]
MKRDKVKKAVPLLAALITLTLLIPIYNADLAFIQRLRDVLFDTYQVLHPRDPYEQSVVVILDIDEASLENIGQWPWPRSYLASIVDYLQRAGVGVVAFDVLFSEADRTSPDLVMSTLPEDAQALLSDVELPNNDEIFASVISRGGVVLGQSLLPRLRPVPAELQPERFGVSSSEPHASRYLIAYPDLLRPVPVLEEAAAGYGLINIIPDSDGVIRTVPLFLSYRRQAPESESIEGEAAEESSPETAQEESVDTVSQVHATLGVEALSVYLHRLAHMQYPESAPERRTYLFKTVGGSGETGYGEETGIVEAALGSVSGLRFRVQTDQRSELRLHYAHANTQDTISMWDLVSGEVDPNELAGAIVLVGASATGLRDLRFNTLGEEIPGVFVHGQVIDQIMSGHFLTRPDYARGVELITMVILSAALIAVVYRLGAIASGLLGLTIAGMGLGGSYYAFLNFQLLFDPVWPSIAAFAVFMVCSAARYWQTESDQRFIRGAFKTFVSPNLVESLAHHPEALKLGGTRKECTFIFTDLAGFTSFVEKSDPEVAVPLLNDYIDNMVRIGLKHGGYLDKIVGDATVFHFNAFLPPLDQPDHQQRAYDCAMEMDAWASAYSTEKRAEGIPLNETRIGINSGEVTMGNFGGAVMDYTAHGDAINTAARLESAGKFLGVHVSLSGATLEGVEGFVGRPCGTLVLKGQTVGTPVYEPMSQERFNGPAIQQYMAAYALMLEEDAGAEIAMEEVLMLDPEDGLAKMHLERLRRGENGIRIVMTSK